MSQKKEGSQPALGILCARCSARTKAVARALGAELELQNRKGGSLLSLLTLALVYFLPTYHSPFVRPQRDPEELSCPLPLSPPIAHLPGQLAPGAPWALGLLGIQEQQTHRLFPGDLPSPEPHGNLQSQ